MDPKKCDFCSDYHSGAQQKLTYLQIDLILSFASLSLGASCFVDAFTINWNSLYFYAFPPFCKNSQMPAKDVGGTKTSANHNPTTLAHPSLVARTIENVNCNPICVAEAGGPTFTKPLKEEIDYIVWWHASCLAIHPG